MDREVTRRTHRYVLAQEIDGTDAGHLIDALEDEAFHIRDVLGESEMVRQIREGELQLDLALDAPAPWFRECLRTLSVYISEYIVGLEFIEGRNAADIRVATEVRKHVARRGELIVVRVRHRVSFETGDIEAAEEDVAELASAWSTLPRWAQDAYRIKFPELRRL